MGEERRTSHGSRSRSARSRLVRVLAAALGFGLFGASIFALHRLLGSVSLSEVLAGMRAVTPVRLAGALLATAAGYLSLIGYDWTALRGLGLKVPLRVVVAGGFLGYSFGNAVGASVVSGTAVRTRIYSAFGRNALALASVASLGALAFGLGISLAGLAALAAQPAPFAARLMLAPATLRVGALALLLLLALGIGALALHKHLPALKPAAFPARPAGLLLGQLTFTAVETCMAALALFILLPPGTTAYGPLLALYAVAAMVGRASRVPGGAGIFEAIVIAALPASADLPAAAAALLLYRLIYTFLPFVLAMILVSINEMRLVRGPIRGFFGDIPRSMQPVSRAMRAVAPTATGTMGLGLGAYLLIAAIMPGVRTGGNGEEDFLAAVLLEGGAMLSAAFGVLLILLAQGLIRRISAAFWITEAALAGGGAASLLNGLDIESAALLSLAGLLLWPLRREFYRAARLTQNVLSPGWFALVAAIGLSAAAFLYFTQAGTPGLDALLVRFGSGESAARALRAGLVASALLLIGLIHLAMQPRRVRRAAPDAATLERAAGIIRAQDDPNANLALTGDKQFLFSESGDAFIMYAVQGKSWIAYADPVGPEKDFRDLAWAFFDAAYAANARPVFYEVSERTLPIWVEMGLSLHKLGEEAVVRLPGFSLAGKKFKKMRAARNQALGGGLRVELGTPPHGPELMATLKVISEEWLSERKGHEKGFSVGRFDPAYLARCPVALVRRENKPVAFANLLTTDSGREVSVDLMRYLPGAGDGLMEFLFIELMEHYRDIGAESFSLGMAPLAGLEAKRGTRLWNRFGATLYRHGGTFYNFAGLRAFKQKFAPEWRPRYLAVPSALPPIAALRDVTLLISGGARGILTRPAQAKSAKPRVPPPHTHPHAP